MTVLCIGGAGTVGRSLVPFLRERNEAVRLFTHDTDLPQTLAEDVQVVRGDPDNPGTIRNALEGVRSVFLAVPMGQTEAFHSLGYINAMTQSQPEHLVFLSSDVSARAPDLPHAGTKAGIEAIIRASGIDYTILRPTFFCQADYRVKDAIMDGAYPFPLGRKPVFRVDVRDVVEVAAAALLDGAAVNETMVLSSLDAPNGDETAEIWSEALGRPIKPPSHCADVWASHKSDLSPSVALELDALKNHFEAQGHPLNRSDLGLQAEVLGRSPRRYYDFVNETAETWLKDAS